MTQEVRDLNCKNCQATTELVPILDDICVSGKSPAKYNSKRVYHLVASATSYGGLLKFMLLFGYLTLQGSQLAVAGTDVASGLQSIPYLGDLGDISTGFASVRRISLHLLQLEFHYTNKVLKIVTSITVLICASSTLNFFIL